VAGDTSAVDEAAVDACLKDICTALLQVCALFLSFCGDAGCVAPEGLTP
jgi:hypothetical protein